MITYSRTSFGTKFDMEPAAGSKPTKRRLVAAYQDEPIEDEYVPLRVSI